VAVAPLLAAGAALLSAFTILRGYGPHDEGLMLAWAGRIADGQWPYRDFWCNYGPGQPLVLAGLVKALGPSLLWWRVLRVALDALVAVLAYRLVRREAGPGWALGAWLAVAGAMAFPTGPGPNPPALALALAALLAVRRTPAGAGALAGLAIAVRPEIGLAVAAAVVVTSRSWRPAASAGAVAGVVLAPFVLVAGAAMADQVLGFAAIQGQQRLPFPLEPDVGWDLNRLFEHFFPALLVVGAVGPGWPGRRRPGLSAGAHRRVSPRPAVRRAGRRARAVRCDRGPTRRARRPRRRPGRDRAARRRPPGRAAPAPAGTGRAARGGRRRCARAAARRARAGAGHRRRARPDAGG